MASILSRPQFDSEPLVFLMKDRHEKLKARDFGTCKQEIINIWGNLDTYT